ncbi:MAG TPA: hypothetical protein PLP27_07225 [Crocinitomicaceae bacterium]|nr:hypothetical protein [Crocinitomicaceae bacterium]
MKKKFLIRYNTHSVSDTDHWRIIDEENNEILVAEIRINVPSYTSKDVMEDVGVKFHIACEGALSVEDNVAVIN